LTIAALMTMADYGDYVSEILWNSIIVNVGAEGPGGGQGPDMMVWID